jgi:hypothetical protein
MECFENKQGEIVLRNVLMLLLCMMMVGCSKASNVTMASFLDDFANKGREIGEKRYSQRFR